MRTLSNADVAMGKIDSKTGKYVSGFRSIGINIFDSTGKIRPLIDIIKDLNKAFDGLTNEQKIEKLSKLGFDQATSMGFGTLMQDIAGLEKATKATEGAQNALNKAYMDSLTPTEQWGVIQNNIKASMIKMGEKLLPMVTTALEKLQPVFSWIFDNIDAIVIVLGTLATAWGALTVAVWANNIAMYANPIGLIVAAIIVLIDIITAAIVKYDEWGASILLLMGPFGMVISAIKSMYDHWESIIKAFQTEGIIGGLKRIGQVLLDVILKPLEQMLSWVGKLTGWDWAKNARGSVNELRGKMDLIKPKEENTNKQPKTPKTPSLYGGETLGGGFSEFGGKGGAGKKTKDKLKNDISKVEGDAKQIKNITIKFDNIHKGDNIINSGSGKGMTMQEFEDFYNEMMMRIIRNAETI